MIQPDPEILGLDRKQSYDEVIIEMISHPEGDLFISDAMMEFHLKKDPSAGELDLYMDLAQEAHDKFNFAIIFQNCLRASFWACSSQLNEFGVDYNTVQTDIQSGFFYKYLYMIEWLWIRVKKYGVWAPIRFLGSLATVVISKKKS